MQLVLWAAFEADVFDIFAGPPNRFIRGGGGEGRTETAIFDPITGDVEQFTIDQTEHDMFCPGISTLRNGDIVVTGGQDALKTSVFDFSQERWVPRRDMRISRGYGSSVILGNDKVHPAEAQCPPAMSACAQRRALITNGRVSFRHSISTGCLMHCTVVPNALRYPPAILRPPARAGPCNSDVTASCGAGVCPRRLVVGPVAPVERRRDLHAGQQPLA